MRTRGNKLITSCILLFTMVAPYFAVPGSAAVPEPDLRLDQKVQSAFALGHEEYDVIAFFKKSDTSAIEQTLSKPASTMNREMLVHQYVGDLRQAAAISQNGAIRLLETAKKRGDVKSFESAYIVNAIHVVGSKESILALAKDPNIETIRLNEKHRMIDPVKTMEADPLDSNISWNVKMLNSPGVWNDFQIDGTGTTVGIIDSGVEFGHPALKRKWRGYDAATDTIVEPEKNWFEAIPSYFIEQSPIPEDTQLSHGTHVAGIILGSEESGLNQVGVAPGAKYIAARTFDSTGNTDDFILIRAGEWMLAPGGDVNARPDVVNCSWADGNLTREWYRDIVKAWRTAGIVPVFAAGNARPGDNGVGAYSIENPANYKEAFAVGAVNKNYRLGGFSKKGPSIFEKDQPVKGIKPDIAAPGVAIRSSIVGKGYALKDGTSMAAPHITGTVALLRQANPGLTVSEIEEIIKTTAKPGVDEDEPTSPNMSYGYGIVDTYAAVSKALNKGSITIQGNVLVAGEDTDRPDVMVEIPYGTYLNQVINVTLRANDDNGISEVSMEVLSAGKSEWKTIPLKKVYGQSKEVRYEGVIAGEDVLAGTMKFRWNVTDSVGNVTSEEQTREIHAALRPKDAYRHDLEQDVEGWLFTGDFKQDVLSPWSMPGYLGARSGERVIGTKPSQLWDVTENTVSTATMPPIDLTDPSLKQPSVGYYLRYLPGRDFTMVVEASKDLGKTWKEMRTYQSIAQFWVYDQIDLSEFQGQPNVSVRFRMEIKEDKERGFFIDDVSLTSDAGNKPAAPIDFEVTQVARGPKLNWNTSQDDNREYRIYRGMSADAMELIHTFPAVKSLSIVGREYIDTKAANGKKHYYQITAVDHFGNESDPTAPQSITNQAIVPLYYSDFEDNDGNLLPVAMGELNVVDWEWGTPIHVSGNPSKVWATKLEKGVTSGSEYALEMPEITIPPKGAQLTFKSLTHIYWDPDPTQFMGENFVQVTDDGGKTWKNLLTPEDLMVWEKQKLWFEFKASLTEYAGKTIKIRFYSKNSHIANSNPSYPEYGWYLDDVEVAPVTDTVAQVPQAVKLQPELTLNKKKSLSGSKQSSEPSNVAPTAETAAVLPEGTLPLEGASIVIKETGVNTLSDEVGHYRLNLASDLRTYTMIVDKYGYHTQTKTFTVSDSKTIDLNVTLQKKQNGSVNGRVVDPSGTGIADAYVRLLEDSNVPIVQTGADGSFTLPQVLEGSYTLRAIASGHGVKEQTLVIQPGEEAAPEVILDKVQTSSEWIIYDNGKKTDTIAFNRAGSGFAVGFTALGSGRLSSASLYFVDDWQDMYGTEIKIGVLKKNSATGLIEKAAEFEPYTIERGQFNEIDLTKLGVELKPNEEFYIATEQMYGGGNNPALGIDIFSPYSDRSFVWNGSLVPLDGFDGLELPGSLMIRAKIEYKDKVTAPPLFDGLEPISYKNEANLSLSGTTVENGTVSIYQNKQMIHEVEVDSNRFSLPVKLQPGSNEIYATLTTKSGKTSESSVVHQIVLDTMAPVLNVTEPLNLDVVDDLKVMVKGTVSDDNIDRVLINGVRTELTEGTFEMEAVLVSGRNEIMVDAFDLAGNRTRQLITVTSSAPVPGLEIREIRPDVHVTLRGGESAVIHAETVPGALATYTVTLPNQTTGMVSIPLPEVKPGVYEALWTAPMDLAAENMVVRLHFAKDQARAEATAPGRINVLNEDLIQPDPAGEVLRINGKNRFDTAAQLSAKTYRSADTVVLANGTALADALFAGPLALASQAPVLLIGKDEVPEMTRLEIERLGAKNVIIIGGNKVISDELAGKLAESYEVRRIGGIDRYDTSRLIANEVLDITGSRSAFFVGPDRYADAVAASANVRLADLYGISPIVMVKEGRIPQLKAVARGFILGGLLSISDDLAEEIHARGYALERIEGNNRHETAVKLAERFMGRRTSVLLSNGTSPVDALVAGIYCATNDVPLLTVLKESVPVETEKYIQSSNVKRIILTGGELVISKDVGNYLLLLIK